MNLPVNLLAVGLSHRTAPVEVRERFAIPETRITGTLDEMVSNGFIREAAILSTCNRVEVYAVCSGMEKARQTILEQLNRNSGMTATVGREFYTREWRDSVQHLYEVCAGLDSMVVGETEILGQVKDAYRIAHGAHRTGLALNRLFQSAFSVAKEIRSRTRIGMGSVSVGSVAVDLAGQIFGDLSERAILLVGAGKMGETTARHLQSRGAKSILVTNRSSERAISLAKSLGGKAILWDRWHEECSRVDIVISSTSAPQWVITREELEPVIRQRKGASLFLIDIAVPRDIERDVGRLEGVYLYDMDDLQVIADRNLAMRQEEIAICRQIIRERVDQFQEWFMARARQIAMCPTARKLEVWRREAMSLKEGLEEKK